MWEAVKRLILLISCNMCCPWINPSVARREAVLETFFAFFNLLLFYSGKIIVEFCLWSCNSSKQQKVLFKLKPYHSCSFLFETGDRGDTINLPGMPGLKGEVGVPGLTGINFTVDLWMYFFHILKFPEEGRRSFVWAFDGSWTCVLMTAPGEVHLFFIEINMCYIYLFNRKYHYSSKHHHLQLQSTFLYNFFCYWWQKEHYQAMIIEDWIAKSRRFRIELLGNVLKFPCTCSPLEHQCHIPQNLGSTFKTKFSDHLARRLFMLPDYVSTLTRRMSLCGKTRTHSVAEFTLCLFA